MLGDRRSGSRSEPQCSSGRQSAAHRVHRGKDPTVHGPAQHGRRPGVGAVVDGGPAGVGVLVHAGAELGPVGLLVGGAQHAGGVDHGLAHAVRAALALLVLGPLHGLQRGQAVGHLAWAGDQGLDVVLDGGLVH